jgi:hypothetical protein
VFDNTNEGSEFAKEKAVARTEEAHAPVDGGKSLGATARQVRYNRFTVVKDLKKELGPGLPSDMLKQLGIRKEDL